MKSHTLILIRSTFALLTVVAIVLHPYIPEKTFVIYPRASTFPALYGATDKSAATSVGWIDQIENEWTCNYSQEPNAATCGETFTWKFNANEDEQSNQDTAIPICTSGKSDDDGDGWGWENEQSCMVDTAASTGQEVAEDDPLPEPAAPVCSSRAADPDGDGWGWENNSSCLVTADSAAVQEAVKTENGVPTCSEAAVDPDGDGWGWENEQSCIVPSQEEAEAKQEVEAEIEALKPVEPESLVAQTNSIDFSQYDGLAVQMDYIGKGKYVRLHLRNHNPRYSDITDFNSPKFMTAFLRTEDLKGGTTYVSLREFSVAEWWILAHNAPRDLAAVDLDNITSLGIDLIEPGQHNVRVNRIALVGERISKKNFLFCILAFWVAYLLVEAGSRYYRLLKIYRRRVTEINDLTSRAASLEAEKKALQARSVTDGLTGLQNRNGFYQKLHLLCETTDLSQGLGLVVLDIDHFKHINDSQGHDIGDRILKNFADLVAANVRADDILSRWGGEEFVLVCPSISLEALLALAEKLRYVVEQFPFEPTLKLRVTVSSGITHFNCGDSFEEAFKRADAALYRAKIKRNVFEYEPWSE
jgi:diguanylate cyclase (GGDEF) domain